MKRRRGPNHLVLALSSAVLLILAFPNFNQTWCAWVALVPWLILLCRVKPREAFRWSWGIGFMFFLASMWWMVHLTAFGGAAAVLGWVALGAYLALYFGAFGWIVCRVQNRRLVLDRRQETGDRRPTANNEQKVSGLLSHVSCLMFPPAAWVALEYVRSHVLTGLGWNLLGYSQAVWWKLIQVADVTGVWGVSFLIVLVNAVIAQLMMARRQKGASKRAVISGFAVVCGLWSVVWYGDWRVPRVSRAEETVRVAVVQGNIPQDEKWDDAHRETILARYEALTREAAGSRPDLIVWPETSVPGYLGLEETVTQRVAALAESVGVPLLVGAPMGHLAPQPMTWRITNAAALVNATGALADRYDKIHLVPLGEFIPFERYAPWLRQILPPIGEFVPGDDYTVFNAERLGHGTGDMGRANSSHVPRPPGPPVTSAGAGTSHDPRMLPPFSVLICFEDLFPDLARRFVQRGAQLLLVITNDAWFGPTAAAYQHLQASIFRAVELRVPVARAANTGWSGCIDSTGWVVGRVRGNGGRDLFVSGTRTCDLFLGTARSPYVRWGDWFPLLCLLLTLAALFLRSSQRH